MTIKNSISIENENNPFNMAREQLDIVAKQIKLDPNIHKFLGRCEKSLIVTIPLIMDDGNLRIFEGYRVHHSTVRGPGKGGIRYSELVSLEEVKALAFYMTFKTSLFNLPLGGAKGGISVNPNKLSNRELERLTRRYTAEIIDMIGPDKDIPAPDVGTDAQIMAWVMDTYSMQHGKTVPGVVTGKPIEIGGSPGRSEATGMGLYYIIEKLCEKLKLDLQSQSVIIQGFGKVGSVIAKKLCDRGCKILAVMDSTGTIFSENGLNVDKLLEWKNEGKFINECKADTIISIPDEDFFKLECDIFIPAATENQIDQDRAQNIKCRIIVEGANGPTTPKADKVLKEKNVLVVPDILANGGGVTVSYFEYVQDINAYYWDLERVNKELKRIMLNAFDSVWDLAQEKSVSLRSAAYIIAVSRVAKAIELRGIFP